MLETSSRDADFGPLPGGGEGVRSYGEPARELAALTGGCGLIDRSWAGLVEVGGEDRARFLNGFTTRDVQALQKGQGAYGFITGLKGQVLSDVVIRACDSTIRLETAPGKAGEVAEHISRYVVADRVEIALVPQLVPLTLAGPEAGRFLTTPPMFVDDTTTVGRFLEDGAPWRHLEVELLGRRLGLSVDDRLGVPAFSFWVDSEAVEDLRSELLEIGRGLVVPAGHLALDLVRIAAGVPWFGRDFDDTNLPQESGLEGTVDYEKGCYLGQEVVARLHYRGQVSRVVRRVEVGEPADAGVVLLLDGREAGRLTSSGEPSDEGALPGLAMLQRRAMEEGTLLETEAGIPVEVLGPPTGGDGGATR